MITLNFLGPNRKIIKVEVDEKTVRWFDDNWMRGVQIYPRSEPLLKALLDSKSPRMKAYGLNILEANKGKNLEEYEACDNEEDIANMIRKDFRSKGLKELK